MESELSSRFEKYRVSAGLTTDEIAEKLGVDKSLAEEWENGTSSPDDDALIALAGLYDVTVDQLTCLDPDEVIRDDGSVISPLPKETNAETKDIVFKKRDRTARRNRFIFFTALSAVVYAALGLIFGLWHPLWVLFIAVPVEVSVFDVIEYRSIRKLNFPFLVTFVYLLFGCLFGWWHPSWLVFITVPVFYMIF